MVCVVPLEVDSRDVSMCEPHHQHCSCILQSGSRHHTLTKIIEPEILAAQFVLVLIWLLAGESQGKFKVGCVSVGE